MERLRVGVVGLQRGKNLIYPTVAKIKGVEAQDNVVVTAICDLLPERVEAQKQRMKDLGCPEPLCTNNFDDLLKKENCDVVIIATGWENHIPLAIKAMRAGMPVGMEVGGAFSVNDCFELVRAYEETKTPFMFLENCCFDKRELMVTKMVREGLFGEISYCHGAYSHDLRQIVCGGGGIITPNYRTRQYKNRNCENYPTHQLGPICKVLNINRGNRLLSLTSTASKARGLNEWAKTDERFSHLIHYPFAQGDVVNTAIKCADGTLITLKLNTTLPTPYCREFTVQGTKGSYLEWNDSVIIDGDGYDENNNTTKNWGNAKNYEKYLPDMWKDVTPEVLDLGHGGMDFFMLREFYNNLRLGKEMPCDVYDAATWMVISVLSEQSIAMGGAPVPIPDFTHGEWVKREPKDVIDL